MKASLLLEYYKKELDYLRELGQEFSDEHAEVAENIGLGSQNITDPYVERLIESVAFLTGRINYKIDSAYPRLAEQLIAKMFPQIGEPLPSVAIFQLNPDKVVKGDCGQSLIDKGSSLLSVAKPPIPQCRFVALNDVCLSSAKVESIEPLEYPFLVPDCISDQQKEQLRSAIKIHLGSLGKMLFQIPSKLELFIDLIPSEASLFFQQFFVNSPVIVLETDDGTVQLSQSCCTLNGFSSSSSMMSDRATDFESYRYALEYFHFPEKFQFFTIDLSHSTVSLDKPLTIWLLSESEWLQSEGKIKTETIRLNCVTAINKFKRRIDRINLQQNTTNYPVYVERVNPLDYEILAIDKVEGFGFGNDRLCEFMPVNVINPDNCHIYETRRESFFIPDDHAADSTQMFIKVSRDTATHKKIKQLGLEARCSNRHWPVLLKQCGGEVKWFADSDNVFSEIHLLRGPCACYHPPVGEHAFWSLVRNIANQISYLLSEDPVENAGRLRQFFSVFIQKDTLRHKQLCESISAVYHHDITKRIYIKGIWTVVRGIHVDLHLNDETYPHGESWLLGTIIERMLANWLPVNSFIELSLHSKQFGHICTWPIRTGSETLL